LYVKNLTVFFVQPKQLLDLLVGGRRLF